MPSLAFIVVLLHARASWLPWRRVSYQSDTSRGRNSARTARTGGRWPHSSGTIGPEVAAPRRGPTATAGADALAYGAPLGARMAPSQGSARPDRCVPEPGGLPSWTAQRYTPCSSRNGVLDPRDATRGAHSQRSGQGASLSQSTVGGSTRMSLVGSWPSSCSAADCPYDRELSGASQAGSMSRRLGCSRTRARRSWTRSCRARWRWAGSRRSRAHRRPVARHVSASGARAEHRGGGRPRRGFSGRERRPAIR